MVFCRFCAASNTAVAKFCQSCWVVLTNPLVSEEEADQLRRRLLRQKRQRQITRYGMAVASSVAIVVYSLANTINLPVPAPVTAAAAPSGPGQWALPGKDVAHTSFAEQAPVVQGELLWTFETEAPLRAAPAVADGVVYQTTGDARIVALDATDGRLLWERETTGPVGTSPALTEDTVYVGLRDGRVLALARDTGQERWSFHTGSTVSASPTVWKGVVYVGTGIGYLMAIDAQTGEELWSFVVGDRLSSFGGPRRGDWIVGTPIINENVLAVAGLNGVVHFFDLTKGMKRLKYTSSSSSITSPAFDGERLFLTTDYGQLIALDSSKVEYPPEERFRRFRKQWYLWGLQKAPPSPKGFLWSAGFPGRVGVSSPAVADGRVFVVTKDGTLYAFDVATGEEMWTYVAPDPALASPVVGGDFVYMGTEAGEIHVVDRHNGTLLSIFSVGSSVGGQLVLANDSLFVVSRSGTLYAFK